jgi:hypothetical protein
MSWERRSDPRIDCPDCQTDRLISPSQANSLLIYYVNLSSRGICAFYMGVQTLHEGEVFYLLRRGIKKVFYKVCWQKEVCANTYRVGLKILDSGKACSRHPEQSSKLQKVKYGRRQGDVGLGLI